MEKLITDYIDSKLVLYTGLSSSGFAKTFMSRFLDENGTLFTIAPDGSISSAVWNFEKTQITENDQVIFTGHFEYAVTLHSILSDNSSDKNQAVINVSKCFDYALNESKKLKNVGAAGILYAKDGDAVKVLFLPADLFEQCALNTTKENYSQIQGKYLRKGLTESRALQFTRGVIAYHALTGQFPYKEDDTFNRQSDIIDANFVPLSLMINGIDTTLAESVDASLIIEAETEPLPGEKRFQDKKAAARRQAIVDMASAFSTETFARELELTDSGNRKPSMTSMDFVTARNSYIKSHQRKMKISRFFRRNTSTIKYGAIIFLVLFYALWSWISAQKYHATTIGLTSTETCQLLYSGIHNENQTILGDISKGKVMKEMDTKLSGFYVVNREREAQNQDAQTISPAEWLFFTEGTTFWQYGLTNLKVDGTGFRTDLPYPTRANHKEPLTYEDGQFLTTNLSKKHTVSFFFVYYTGPVINVVEETDLVETTYDGKKWVITNVKIQKVDHKLINLNDFKKDYENAVKIHGKNVRSIASGLRAKYRWIPTDLELETGARSMVNKFNNSAAKNLLGIN